LIFSNNHSIINNKYSKKCLPTLSSTRRLIPRLMKVMLLILTR
jgi:hypothetical protein